MVFRLHRVILIDSYCRGRIAELDVSEHITINGENGAGKTTLLRLLPIFFGERPSRIIRGDAVTERFSRYYFPTTASYVVFEYQRRDQKALAVIHANGQSADSIDYRFIDSEYKPELFMENGQVVQTKDIFRHVDKQGILITKPLTLYNYQQIIQNTAGRDHRQLAARFSFVGGTGRLTHLERVVTGILQRATTFHDLKKMIVSSVLNNEEAFSLRTGKRDLIEWINEHEAHFALMSKEPLMAELEQADHCRRMAETGFARLHAQFNLLRDHFEKEVRRGEEEEEAARDERTRTEVSYNERIQLIRDARSEAESHRKTVSQFLDNLRKRRREYDEESIREKIAKVASIDFLAAEREPLAKNLDELESKVKSLTSVFDAMANQVKDSAKDQRTTLIKESSDIHEATSRRKDYLREIHTNNATEMRERHLSELEGVSERVSVLQGRQTGLEVEARTAQADPVVQESLGEARRLQRDANDELERLREKTEKLEGINQKIINEFNEIEIRIDTTEKAIDLSESELEQLLKADSAGEDSLLGFLRRHKPQWATSIGKLVDADTLLRTDLSPMLGSGDDLYGVAIDLEKLTAGRFSSEEAIQQEIKLVRERLEKKQGELSDNQNALVAKKKELDQSKSIQLEHAASIQMAKSAKAVADHQVKTAEFHVQQSKERAAAAAKEKFVACREELAKAQDAVKAMKRAHEEERKEAERRYSEGLADVEVEKSNRLKDIEERRKLVDRELDEKLQKIDVDRNDCLKSKGVSTDVLDGLRIRIRSLGERISEANSFRGVVSEYKDWESNQWSQKTEKELEFEKADAEERRLRRDANALAEERGRIIEEKIAKIRSIARQTEENDKLKTMAGTYAQELSIWPQDTEVLEAGLGGIHGVDLYGLIDELKILQASRIDSLNKIRRDVDDIRRQMSSITGSGPEKFHATALSQLGYPRQGKEYEWLEVFRRWFNDEHASNRTSLLQQGKTMAQKVSAFWNTLNDFKGNVGSFARQLQSSLEQGTLFESISDVSTDIRAHVDTQDYWSAVGNLHREYDAWHSQGSQSLPPASFVEAAREVARVISDESGLVADPVDLISLKISANVNNKGPRTASNEHELANMSSNGLSYIILCVVLIGFVNRIRGNEPVNVPFVVDELKDLSFPNARTLLKLMTQNNITMISAFPDVDLDLAELFGKNYKILPDRKIAMISLDSEIDAEEIEDGVHV